MCDFFSFYIDKKGRIFNGNFRSHESAEKHHNLAAALKSAKPPVPAEWTEGGLRVRLLNGGDANYYRALVLGQWPTRDALIAHCLATGNYDGGGSLSFRGTGLTSLPAGLHVGGSLDLHGCTGLASLPAGLRVGGSLDLRGCTGLASLPADMRVDGWLGLRGCTGLTALPAGLHVGGSLDLGGCTSLASIPDGLRVGGEIYR